MANVITTLPQFSTAVANPVNVLSDPGLLISFNPADFLNDPEFFDDFSALDEEDQIVTTQETKEDSGPGIIQQGKELLESVFTGAVDFVSNEKAIGNIATLITAIQSKDNVSSEEKEELRALREKIKEAETLAENEALRSQLQAQSAQIQAILAQKSSTPAISQNTMLIIGGIGLAAIALLALRK